MSTSLSGLPHRRLSSLICTSVNGESVSKVCSIFFIETGATLLLVGQIFGFIPSEPDRGRALIARGDLANGGNTRLRSDERGYLPGSIDAMTRVGASAAAGQRRQSSGLTRGRTGCAAGCRSPGQPSQESESMAAPGRSPSGPPPIASFPSSRPAPPGTCPPACAPQSARGPTRIPAPAAHKPPDIPAPGSTSHATRQACSLQHLLGHGFAQSLDVPSHDAAMYSKNAMEPRACPP